MIRLLVMTGSAKKLVFLLQPLYHSLHLPGWDLLFGRVLLVSPKLTDPAGDVGQVYPKTPAYLVSAIPLFQHQLDSVLFEFLCVFDPILSLVHRTPPF